MGCQLQLLYLRKSIDNSLHFNVLRRMLFEIAYDSVSLTMKFNIEGESLGTTSRTVKWRAWYNSSYRRNFADVTVYIFPH